MNSGILLDFFNNAPTMGTVYHHLTILLSACSQSS